MSTATVWDEASGVAPGLRDALRSLMVGALGAEELWRLGDGEVTDALAVVGQARQLLEAAEVALVREGIGRGLPREASLSAQDWVSTVEGSRAPVPPVRHVAQVVRVARAGLPSGLTANPAPAEGARAGEGPVPVGVDAVREAFTGGDLPLGKADQLVRFHAQIAPVAEPDLLEADLQVLLSGARDDVIEAVPVGEGRPREVVRRSGLSEKELAAAISRTGRLSKPERDQDREIGGPRPRGR